MAIIVITTDENYQKLQDLNYKNEYHFERLEKPRKRSVIAQLEKFAETHKYLVIDYEGIEKCTIDDLFDIVSRIKTSTPFHIILLLSDFNENNTFIQDFIDIGIPQGQIITSSGIHLKKDLQYALPKTSTVVAGTIRPSTDINEIDLTNDAATSNETQDIQPLMNEPEKIPSQIGRMEARKSLIPKQPISEPATKAISIALAGTGKRIGTTTQAMQLLMFLTVSGYSAALIEMTENKHISEYLNLYDEKDITLIDETHFQIKDLHFYKNANSLLKAKSAHQYIILDYGDFNGIADKTSYLDKDIKIICTGIKPQESEKLSNVFDADDGTVKYIFSFVPAVDEPAVINDMNGNETFFAFYTPDYFTYGGADTLYQSICKMPTLVKDEKPKKLFGFIKK